MDMRKGRSRARGASHERKGPGLVALGKVAIVVFWIVHWRETPPFARQANRRTFVHRGVAAPASGGKKLPGARKNFV
jgi:hypothetical protein